MGGFSLWHWLIALVPAVVVAAVGHAWKRSEFVGGLGGLIVAAGICGLAGGYLLLLLAAPETESRLGAAWVLGVLLGATIGIFISHRIFAERSAARGTERR